VLLCLLLILALAVVGHLIKTFSQGTKTVAAVATALLSAGPSESAATDTDSPSAGSISGGTPGTMPSSTSATVGASGSDDPSAGAGLGGGTFAPPFGTQYLDYPADSVGAVSSKTDVTISNVDYPDNTELYCPTTGLDDWNVAGYATFTATFGIPDDAQYATGITDTMTFTDQNGKALGTATTTIGQPAKVTFPLTGVVRLVMSCARQGSNASNNNLVALGNASVSTSGSD